MSEKTYYPQIPGTVWWGVRNLLQLKPTANFDARLLATQLGVQEVAAKAYLKQLVSVGIIDENGRATDLANRWRHNETYLEAADGILQSVYPESLLLACPPGEIEREKVVSWFMMDGLGKGSAGNRAATYILLASREPQDATSSVSTPAKPEKPKKTTRTKPATAQAQKNSETSDKVVSSMPAEKAPQHSSAAFPLNVNLQIHISADASGDQIDQIFKSMRTYLYDN